MRQERGDGITVGSEEVLTIETLQLAADGSRFKVQPDDALRSMFPEHLGRKKENHCRRRNVKEGQGKGVAKYP